ncbi:MAG: DUF5362 family protein [Bacteroidota bacterium]
MESENTNPSSESSSLYELNVTEVATMYLTETSKWAKFLSILGFILCGFMVFGGLFAGTMISMFSGMAGEAYEGAPGMAAVGPFLGVFYILAALLYFFPSYYLFKFSDKLKNALYTMDSQVLTKAFENLKSVFKFWGILAIVVLAIYGLIFVFSLIPMLFLAA